MKSDFLLAITQLSAEKNLPREVVISAVEAALLLAYRKDNFAPNQNISVKISLSTGKVQVWAEKTVVERVTDTHSQASLSEARRIKSGAQVGDLVMVESTPANAGRIAAQTAKQVILQRLHEAEHTAIFDEYANREADIITGTVQRIESRQVIVDLGRTEAVLPSTEQIPGERYRVGQRVRAAILEVAQTNKGPRVVLTRANPSFLRRLFELEVPEIANGVVDLKSVAREPGSRSKVAVAARQEGVDPIGCCVGLRGIRIQNIVSELSGEKIDVVAWNPDPATFIANALSPAHILSVEADQRDKVASVVVPDRQLSLAIGKEGQNVRLAAKLTGWRIDIKSATAAEAEKIEIEKATAARVQAVVGVAEKEEGEAVEEALAEASEAAKAVHGAEPEKTPVETEKEPVLIPTPVPTGQVATPRLRFAEEILSPAPAATTTKAKKKKKGRDWETEEKGGAGKRARREHEDLGEDEY